MLQGDIEMRKNAFLSTENREKNFCSDFLSADEEKELSKRILAGEAAKAALLNSEILSETEKSSLEDAIETGKQAYDRLVLANVPRAMKIAAETMQKNPRGLNDFEDYRQTALKVICTCARTYDWKTGCRFGTYVHRSLQHEMMRENAKTGYAVRIPEENLPQLGSLRRLAESKGIEAAADELALSADSACRLLLAGSLCRSLQDPTNADDPETELGELIADTSAMTAEEIDSNIDREWQMLRLHRALAQLPVSERDLLKGRMGFGGDPLPMKAFVGRTAKSISGVQKKQEAAVKHLREIYFSLPMAD